MSLRITFTDAPGCRRDADGVFRVRRGVDAFPFPDIRLGPDETNIPHVVEVRFKLGEASEDLREAFRVAFPPFHPPKPVKLTEEKALKPRNLTCRPVDAATEFTIEVIAVYYDSDRIGELRAESPRELRVPVLLELLPNAIEALRLPDEQETPHIEDGVFPGWIALDFGTSASTITAFNPKRVPSLEGMPREQYERLRQAGHRWLLSSPSGKNERGERLADEWQRYLAEISSNLTRAGDVFDVFTTGDEAAMHAALALIEDGLALASEELRKYVLISIHRLHHAAFRIPPLEDLLLARVELEPSTGALELSSELEITAIAPLGLAMGPVVRQNRLAAIAGGVGDIRGRFHKSLKNHLSRPDEKRLVRSERGLDRIPARALIEKTIGHLLELGDGARNRQPEKFASGRIERAIVTYPAASPPTVRVELEGMLKRLGIPHVVVRYDEAISSAIFFLMREFGGALGSGVEAWKTRCRRRGDRWSQNVLVLDIGGGTTDIALIRLELREEDPFAPGEDRGAGGRYYVMTPHLLGSTGHVGLGGDLITLRTFLVLKASIADALYADADAHPESAHPKVRAALQTLGAPFVADARYVSRALVDHSVKRRSPHHKAALDAAERLVPTRWADDGEHLHAFYTLWDHADDAKLQLGRRTQPGEHVAPFELSEHDLRPILARLGPIELGGRVVVRLDRATFEEAIEPTVAEAVRLARGVLDTRLPRTKDDRLDWLILSGQTCNLELIDRVMRRELANVSYFTWNPERVTFNPEYAKAATSIGAAYAEHLRNFTFHPRGAVPSLRQGVSQLYFDIKNLFLFLPCTFSRLTQQTVQDYQEPLFFAGTQLYKIDDEDAGKVRSDWKAATLDIAVLRQDFDGSTALNWGFFDGGALARRLGMSEADWQRNVKLQFEVDHLQKVRMFLCHGRPHLVIEADAPVLDAAAKLAHDPAAHLDAHAERVDWDVAVRVRDADDPEGPKLEHGLFAAGAALDETFEVGEGDTIRGALSGAFPDDLYGPPEAFELVVRHAGGSWISLGRLPRPGRHSDFPQQYRASVDARGRLRLHAGAVPYATAVDPSVLRSTTGRVVIAELEAPRVTDDSRERDPFNGTH